MKFFVKMMFLWVALAAVSAAVADPVWVPFGSSDYALSEIGGTWTECEAEAITHGAHLVAVNSADENAWLVDQFGELPLWIGLSETDNDGIYVWANGDTLGYEAWAPGQPDWLTWDHDYVSINLQSSIGLWHNSHDTGYPGGTPSTGIMERPGATPVVGTSPMAPDLLQNSPNPFNPLTEISFELSTPAFGRLVVFDMAGREVRILVEGELRAETRFRVVWDGRDAAGRAAPSGCYYYRLEAGGYREARSMVLLR